MNFSHFSVIGVCSLRIVCLTPRPDPRLSRSPDLIEYLALSYWSNTTSTRLQPDVLKNRRKEAVMTSAYSPNVFAPP